MVAILRRFFLYFSYIYVYVYTILLQIFVYFFVLFRLFVAVIYYDNVVRFFCFLCLVDNSYVIWGDSSRPLPLPRLRDPASSCSSIEPVFSSYNNLQIRCWMSSISSLFGTFCEIVVISRSCCYCCHVWEFVAAADVDYNDDERECLFVRSKW